MNRPLSRRSYYADFFVAPAIVIILGLASTINARWIAVALSGLAAWTLVEYFLHRFILHPLASLTGHMEHHRWPQQFYGASTFYAESIFAVILAASTFLFGFDFAAAAVAGFMTGYSIFIFEHDAIHRRRIRPGDWLYGLKRNHLLHHEGTDANYGVITPFWDKVFRTYQKH